MSGQPAPPSGPCAHRGTIALLVALLSVAVACAPNVPVVEDPLAGASTGTVPLPDNVGPTDCHPVSPAHSLPDGASEIEGAAEAGPRAALWAKVEGGIPPPSGREFRILWRIRGATRLRLTALGPGGEQIAPILVAPTSEPDWDRPGDAWTSTFNLPSPGCWRVNASRGQIHGDVWFQVG